MRKWLCAMLLMLLLLGSAEAEVKVEQLGGEAYCSVVRLENITFQLNWEEWRYETDTGLCLQAGAIPLSLYGETLMPQSTEEVCSMNQLLAALADASDFWEDEISVAMTLPVYTMRSEEAVRAANGKARVVLAEGAKLLMTWDDWALVEYQVSDEKNRIGWVHQNVGCAAPVMLADVVVQLKEEAFLTDDPAKSREVIATANELKDVHLLAAYGGLWGYVGAKTPDGQLIGGFVPLRLMERKDTVDEATMAKLSGTWGFVGGGELMPIIFTLVEDGTVMTYTLSDEAMESQDYLTQGVTAAMQLTINSRGTWKVVTGTGSYAQDLVVEYSDGRVGRYHLDDAEENVLSLTQGEAGGSWQRLAQ